MLIKFSGPVQLCTSHFWVGVWDQPASRVHPLVKDYLLMYFFKFQFDCLGVPLNVAGSNESLSWWTDRTEATHVYWTGKFEHFAAVPLLSRNERRLRNAY